MTRLFRTATLVFYFLAGLVFPSCGQNPEPENRPVCANSAFDKKVASTIRFSVPLISVQKLHQNLNYVHVFDTREWDEFSVSHIPGATFIGYKSFDSELLAKIPKEAPIALYCSIGYRSEKIGEQLLKMGFTNVFNVYGSIFEWANQGYLLHDANGKVTAKIHTYNQRWSQWVEEGKLQKTW